MQIELIDTENRHALQVEDWYVHLNGVCYGYLYRSDKPSGYAVGIGQPDGEIEFYSIEGSKNAALEYAKKYIGLLLQSIH
jgi:hypothetical protein